MVDPRKVQFWDFEGPKLAKILGFENQFWGFEGPKMAKKILGGFEGPKMVKILGFENLILQILTGNFEVSFPI